MKKFFTLLALGVSLTAGAQQLQGDFEGWKDCVVYRGGGNTKVVGVDPQGWNGSNISQKGAILGLSDKDDKSLVTQVAGKDGGYAVQLQNKFEGIGNAGAVAPAYVTLGTPWAYASVSGVTIKESDGGTFGGLQSAYRPDGLQFDYKLKRAAGSTQPATVVGYLWTGSYTGTQKVGYNGKEEQMTDRDRYVLGMQQCTASDDAALIAEFQQAINSDADEWMTATYSFEYKDGKTLPEKINVIFCAGDYFGDQSKLERDNIFVVDNVKLIYYHALSALSYEGATLDFNQATTAYDLSDTEYEAAKLSYTKLGQGAKVTTAYDEEAALLSIRVEAEDYNAATNAEAVTTYTVQFKKPAPATAVKAVLISGERFADFDPQVYEYTLPYVYNPGIWFDTETEEGANVAVYYDGENETVTVVEGENSYEFHFTKAVESPLAGTYKGSLSVVLTNGEGDTPTPLDNSNIEVTANANGTVNLALSNFAFMGIPVGNIFVSNVPVKDGKLSAVKTISLTENEDGDLGPMLGALPVQLEATLLDTDKKEIAADIDILTAETDLSMMFSNIHVDFFPATVEGELKESPDFAGPMSRETIAVKGRVSKKAAALLQLFNDENHMPMAYVDLSEAVLDEDVTMEDIMTGATAENNTLVFVAADAAVDGVNVVKGNKAAELKLNAEAPFTTPKAFTAESVSLTYDFKTGDKALQGFVMPFTAATAKMSGKVYGFDGVEGDRANLVSVDEIKANAPYFLYANAEANPFALLTDVNVLPVTESKEETTVTKGDYTFTAHLAAFASEDDTEKALAYNEETETFAPADAVKAKTFDAVLSSTASASFGLRLDGKVTGISDAVNAADDAPVLVYTLDGRLVRRAAAPARALEGLAKGVYVVNGRKVTK